MALALSRDATCYGSTVRLSSAIILIDIMMVWKGQGSRDGGVGGVDGGSRCTITSV